MKILFLMIAYPNVRENSNMFTDLTGEFVSNGHDVYVVVANGPINTFFNIENGSSVLRVRTLKLFNTPVVQKGLANLILPFQVNRAIKKFLKGIVFDKIILSTPPITYLKTLRKLIRNSKTVTYLILRDIFPQNAVDLGILRNKFLVSILRKKEKELYNLCDHIGCMSEGNITYVKKHNPEVGATKLHLLPNWKKVAKYTLPDTPLRSEMGLENKFIAIYGGNFGLPQKTEFILDLAERMMIHENVIFLLIGDGSEKKRLTELATEKNLTNVIFRDPLPQVQYNELVKICNLGLVNLSEKFTIPNIPSRTLSYWEAKIPVLAAIDTNTDFGDILALSESGLSSFTGDIDSYINNFEKLYEDKELRSKMGENGYRYLKDNCTVDRAYSIINEKLSSK